MLQAIRQKPLRTWWAFVVRAAMAIGVGLRSLVRLRIWRPHPPGEAQVALLRHAEFLIMLSELRYPPIGIHTHIGRDAHPSRRAHKRRSVR
jgi:hypothetical protein